MCEYVDTHGPEETRQMVNPLENIMKQYKREESKGQKQVRKGVSEIDVNDIWNE